MGSLATVGLFAVVVLTAFGAVCAFGTTVLIGERFGPMGRARASVLGTVSWAVGSGVPLTIVLVRWAAPSPSWPYWRYDWVEVTTTFVGTISLAGGLLGGFVFLLLHKKR